MATSRRKTVPQPLPCNRGSFQMVRADGQVYVDKTEFVYKIAHDPNSNVFFMGRPRRFGKTMFLSTLEAYFEGRRELFEGLKIMELETEWKNTPCSAST